jgi:hypothetical protein
MHLTFIGVAIGLAAALALTRIMQNLLFNVSATDPATFSLIALLLIGVVQWLLTLLAHMADQRWNPSMTYNFVDETRRDAHLERPAQLGACAIRQPLKR